MRAFALALLGLALASCGDNGPSGPPTDRVLDSFPLEVGYHWAYSLEQSIFVHEDTTQLPFTGASTGYQDISVSRTEMITGNEAFGVKIHHVMDYIFSVGADTVDEMRYLAPTTDRVLLKAEQQVYNPTGGFIPLGETNLKPRLGTLLEVGGAKKFISLEKLAYLLGSPRGWKLPKPGDSLPELASDGIINRNDVIVYDTDYIFVFNQLYKGLNWVSQAAGGVGEVDVSQKVTNILESLYGYEGPVAEVEETNTLIGGASSQKFVLRYYYKGGVGLIRAELSDPEFLIILQLPDGSLEFLGVGTWTFIKKLSDFYVG
ncbi:MAG TPA: hypothetical protein VJ417_05970, partial [Candidatus Glassbacteria bacterium]|nr:hypothetical protein [Candidatus Glassbacteria bacterium]